MALLKFIGLFTFSNGGNQNQQAFDVVCSPLWWSGSTFLQLGETLENHPTLKKERFSSLLNVMVGYLCVLYVKLAGVDLNVYECAGKVENHRGRQVSSHSCLAKVLQKSDFWACRLHSFLCQWKMSITISKGTDKEQVCGHNSLVQR